MWLKAIGINVNHMKSAIIKIPRFLFEILVYRKRLLRASKSAKRFRLKLTQIKPCLNDYEEQSGNYGAYFHQDLWAAKKVFKNLPTRHIDIGSRIDGFIAHLLVFTKVIEIDIRKLESNIEGLQFLQADATKLDLFEDNSIESISSLHVAEHFGLGRYGDEIEPDACFTFMKNLQRVLAKGGKLLFSVPIGGDNLYFNANRKFHPDTILDNFNKLKLISTAGITKQDNLIKDISIQEMSNSNYRVGLFEFIKQ
tara:strand:- start:1698 stop:2456 length:759 start_codon:yes stop_codon:yes gene_type:complete